MIVLKILAAPLVVVLTVLAAVVSFLFCMATAVFVVACVVLTLLAVALFISGQTLGGIVFLVLAFLISPYGIPAIAEWLVDILTSRQIVPMWRKAKGRHPIAGAAFSCFPNRQRGSISSTPFVKEVIYGAHKRINHFRH